VNDRTFLVLALTGLIAGLLLVGCVPPETPPVDIVTPTPTPQQTPEPTPEPTPQPEPLAPPHLRLLPEDLAGTRIRFWHPWSGSMAEMIASSAVEFNRSNTWGIEVEVFAPGGSGALFDAVSERLASADTPHLVAAAMDQIVTWQRLEGVVINLNDYVADAVWGLNPQERADFPRSFWDQGEVDGFRYGIPALQSPQVLFYNAAWGRALGFAHPPESVTEFEAQVCAAAAANRADADRANDGTGGWIVNTDPLAQLAWLYSFGFDPLVEGETIRFNRAAARELFSFFRHLYDRNCIWDARLPEPYEYFATRRALLYSGTLYDLATQTSADRRFGNTDEWIILPYPPSGDGRPVVLTSGLAYAVFAADAREQMAAWLFLRWMSLSRNQAMLAQISGGWPASVQAISELEAYRAENPAWDNSLLWIPLAQPAPVLPEWRLARSVLSDAAWQLFQANIKPEDIPDLLAVLDATVADVLESY
jgi:ABC-type glycerol-3-phosphate transport system substrate-binding protein